MKTIDKVLREKWKEVPAATTQGVRLFSGDLLRQDQRGFLEYWRGMFENGCAIEQRGWYQLLYREAFAGRKVLEVGSGLGFDGVYFLRNGADWTFADIVEDNLRVIERACRLLGLAGRAHFLYIDDFRSFERLPNDFDVIWCNGSLINVPWATAREECMHILPHLRPRGRWIELAYPYERWVREGSKPFSEWGKMTDGERTPWVEWYDVDKLLLRLFPARMSVVLHFNIYGGAMNWMDLVLDSDRPFDPGLLKGVKVDRVIDLPGAGFIGHNGSRLATSPDGLSVDTGPAIWSYAASIELGAPVGELVPERLRDRVGIAIDIECTVTQGSVRLAVSDQSFSAFVCHEKNAAGSPSRQRITIAVRAPDKAHAFIVRNTHGHGASRVTVHKAALRLST